jgi:hypothetical protein
LPAIQYFCFSIAASGVVGRKPSGLDCLLIIQIGQKEDKVLVEATNLKKRTTQSKDLVGLSQISLEKEFRYEMMRKYA